MKGIRALWATSGAVIGLLAAYWAAAALVIGIDPFDLYPWGAAVKPPQTYNQSDPAYAGLIAAKDRSADLVMIGSSPAFLYTPSQILAAFPGSRAARNFSYLGARPRDYDLILKSFVRYSSARRFVIWFDWFHALPPDQIRLDFPTYLYDSDPLNDLRLVNLASIRASLRLMAEGTPLAPDGSLPRLLEEWRSIYGDFQTPAGREQLARLTAAAKGRGPGSQRACSSYAYLQHEALPTIRALTGRGAQVDLIIPPYSLGFYYKTPVGAADYAAPGLPFLDDQLQLRRCLVLATRDNPNVHIWALDLDTAMISDLANYRDPGHLQGQAVLQRSLSHIGDPAYQLTTANISTYADGLERAVAAFDPQASALGTTAE